MSFVYPLDTGDSASARRSHREGAGFDHRANLLTLKGVRKNKAIAVHELMHFFEHCATPFGVFQDELHQRTSHLAFQFLREFQGPVLTPIFPWVRSLLSDPAGPFLSHQPRFQEIVEAHIKPWSHMTLLWDVFEGYDFMYVRKASVSDVAEILRVTEGLISDSHVVNDCGEETCPLMQCELTPGAFVPLGALSVSECMAQIQEGLKDVNPETVAPEYIVLILFGNDLLERSTKKYGKGDRELFPSLLTIADLSLFTPVGTTYHQLRPPQYLWSSVHPGWRFCKAVELVSQEDWWITGLFAAEELGNRVCDRLGWVRPRRFLEIGASLTDAALERHRRACEIRLEDFIAFYRRDRIFDSDLPVGKFLADHLPTIYYPGTGTVCNVPVGNNTIAFEHLKRCILVRRYLEAMLRPMRGRVLPPACKFDDYFDNLRNEEDIVNAMALESPWLHPARFGYYRPR